MRLDAEKRLFALTQTNDEPGFSEELVPLLRRKVAVIHDIVMPATVIPKPFTTCVRGTKVGWVCDKID